MFVLWQQNHTTGASKVGPAACSVERLKEHMAQGEIEWTEGTAEELQDNPPDEWRVWDWFYGSSNNGGTTHTAHIRPLEVLDELRHEERTATWTRDKKAPVLKFDNLDFDILTVRVEGDTTDAFRFTVAEVRRFAKEHEGPRHLTLKIDPHLLRMFRLEPTP